LPGLGEFWAGGGAPLDLDPHVKTGAGGAEFPLPGLVSGDFTKTISPIPKAGGNAKPVKKKGPGRGALGGRGGAKINSWNPQFKMRGP